MDKSRARSLLILATTVLVLLLEAAMASAADFRVTTMFDGDDGLCDASHCTLREAVAASNAAAGFDRIDLPTGGFFNFVLLSMGELSVSDELLIHCDGWLIDVSGGNRGFLIESGAALDLLDCTVRGGDATQGGGFYNRGTLAIRNSRLVENHASDAGGAIYNDGGTLIVRDSKISNSSSDRGAGIFDHMGSSTIERSELETNGASISGAAVLNDGGTMSIREVTFSGNSAQNGGGIYSAAGSTSIADSSFDANVATSEGGAVYVADGLVEFEDSRLVANRADLNGGGIFNGPLGRIRVDSTQILDGVAGLPDIGGNGAGIHNLGTADAFGLELSGNEALFGTTGTAPFRISRGNGGGIFNSGLFHLAYSSVTANQAALGGGGLANRGELHIDHCRIALNLDGGLSNFGAGIASVARSTVADNLDHGIFSQGAELFVSQTTVNDNLGHGIDASNGEVVLHNSTISGSRESGLRIQGYPGFRSPIPLGSRAPTFVAATALHVTVADNGSGGVVVGSNGTLTLVNVLIGDNAGNASCAFPPLSGSPTVVTEVPAQLAASAANLDVDGSCDDATTGDALLADFGDAGGWNQMYALLESSDAIGLGDPAGCLEVGNVDQRDRGREGGCDVGAVEYLPEPAFAVGVSIGSWLLLVASRRRRGGRP